MQSAPSVAAAAAAAAAAIAAAVTKKRLTKLRGQLRNEEEKWERWHDDARTKVRYDPLRDAVRGLRERLQMYLEDDRSSYSRLEDENRRVTDELAGLRGSYMAQVTKYEHLSQWYKESCGENRAMMQRTQARCKQTDAEHKELKAKCEKLLARNHELRKAEGYEVFLENDERKMMIRELREHILMREEDTDAPASGGGGRGHKRLRTK